MAKIWKEIKQEIVDIPPNTKIVKWSTISLRFIVKKIKIVSKLSLLE